MSITSLGGGKSDPGTCLIEKTWPPLALEFSRRASGAEGCRRRPSDNHLPPASGATCLLDILPLASTARSLSRRIVHVHPPCLLSTFLRESDGTRTPHGA